MASTVNTIKSVEFNIQVKYTFEGNIIIQTFQFLPMVKKYFKYAYDTRFTLNDKIEEMINKNLMSDNIENVEFVDRTDNENSIVMKYSFEGEIAWKELRSFFVTLHVYFAPNTGCRYCSRAIEKGDFIFCPERNKTLPSPIKRCTVFKQKRDLIIT